MKAGELGPERMATPDHGHVAGVGLGIEGTVEVGDESDAGHRSSIALFPGSQAVIKEFGGTRHHRQLVAAHARSGDAYGFTTVAPAKERGPTDGRPQ